MIDVDKVQKIFNILICWYLRVKVINPAKYLSFGDEHVQS